MTIFTSWPSFIIKKYIKKYPLFTFSADIYLLKVNNRNSTTRCEICLKLTIKTPERSQFSKYKNGTSIFHDVNKFLNYAPKTMHFQNFLTAWINFWITVHPADERKFSQYFYGTRLIKSFHPVYWNTDKIKIKVRFFIYSTNFSNYYDFLYI